MNPSQAVELGQQALITVMVIAGPILVVGLVVGLLVSIIQAVTQIQEQTLSFIPKIVAMTLAGMILLPWITMKLMDFTQTMLAPLPLE